MSFDRIVIFSVCAAIISAAGCPRRPDAACSKVPEPSSYAMDAPSKDARSARQRAERCIHHEAYRLAPGMGEIEAIAMGVIGACLDQVQAAQSRVYLDVNTVEPPLQFPPGYTVDVPPCLSGASSCKPWERAWNGHRPDVGTVVTNSGRAIDTEKVNKTAEIMSQRVADDLRLIALFRVTEARALRCGT